MKTIHVCRYTLREIMKMRGSREQWLNHCPAISVRKADREFVGCVKEGCQHYLTIEESLEMWAKTVLENWTRTGVAYGSRGWTPGAFPKEPAGPGRTTGKEKGPDG